MTLIAHWPIDDTMGYNASSCRDIAGGGSGAHDGSYVLGSSSQVLPGGYGGRHFLAYGGFGNYGWIDSIANPSDLRITGSLTICGWFWTDWFTSAFGVYDWTVSFRKFVTCSAVDTGSPDSNNLYYFRNYNGKIMLTWQNGANNVVFTETTDQVLLNVGPQHIAVVRYNIVDANYGVRFYLNGELVEDVDNGGGGWLGPEGGANCVPYIGRDINERNFHTLFLDSIRVYNEELDDEAIGLVYAAEAPEVLGGPSLVANNGNITIGTGLTAYKMIHNGPFANRINCGWGQV